MDINSGQQRKGITLECRQCVQEQVVVFLFGFFGGGGEELPLVGNVETVDTR